MSIILIIFEIQKDIILHIMSFKIIIKNISSSIEFNNADIDVSFNAYF